MWRFVEESTDAMASSVRRERAFLRMWWMVQGSVATNNSMLKVEVLVSTAGEVAFASLIDGRPELGPAAILAARGWRFEPARLNGRPIQVSGLITFEVRPPRNR